MKQLPERSNLDHLKKQAKELLRSCKQRESAAFDRLREALPAAAGKDDAAIVALDLRLHDAQSCIAREYGFHSWLDLKSYVEAQASASESRGEAVRRWLRVVYAGEVTGVERQSQPRVAARMLAENPQLASGDSYIACTIGDEAAVRAAIAADPAWVNRVGGPLAIPPLAAVTHSSLVLLPEFRDRLYRCAELLLAAGANPDAAFGNRYPPASLEKPSDEQLSALYGAAGKYFQPQLAKLLLKAGANPDDNESLYHSLDNIECTRALLEAGAKINGTNAFYRVFDWENVPAVRLLLEYGADPNHSHPRSPGGAGPMFWAIRRRRSAECIRLLLEAGADPFAKGPHGLSAYRMALVFGLPEVARLLADAGAAEELSDLDSFVAACACVDEKQAHDLLAKHPGMWSSLSPMQLRLLPEMAAHGGDAAVHLMVELGWPIAARGGDIGGSALNNAVFCGKPALARFLLEHGAQWTEPHNYGGNVMGTLGWASRNVPVPNGDWLGCAAALVEHGMPVGDWSPDRPDCLLLGGYTQQFSEEVAEFLVEVHRSTQVAG